MGDILKHWGSGIFRRIHNSSAQNRCLILKGDQGLGKDFFVKAMLNSFQPYFETSNLGGYPKDIYEIISRIYVMHVEEFEQTKALDVAFIKSIITQSSAFFRESYGRSPSRKNVAVSFISTSNRDDILRDSTGNRRFIVIPTDNVKWTYPADESHQVLAQFKKHFEDGLYVRLNDSIESKIRAILNSYTPPDTNDLIVNLYQARVRARLLARISVYLNFDEVSDVILDVAKQCGVAPKRVQTVIKTKRFSAKVNGVILYYAEPQILAQDE